MPEDPIAACLLLFRDKTKTKGTSPAMNLEKAIFGFIVLAATLNFGFFIGDLDNPIHHDVYQLFAAIVVNLIATVLTGIPLTIIDHAPPIPCHERWVRGDGADASALRAADITEAVGVVACTNDDVNNLAIVVTARELNPKLFLVLRQNLQANQALFDAFESDFTVVPSQIIARGCLATLGNAPMRAQPRTQHPIYAIQLLPATPFPR
jgi:voltage-gated potassium channel Kch